MSRNPLISRHKEFALGVPGAASGFEGTSYDIPDFIRLNSGGAGNTDVGAPIAPTGLESTITAQIGATKWLPVVSGIPSSGLNAQIHAANENLTLSNRGARARYDYYFWQGRDIWRYDSRIETSGIQDVFSSWIIDATPVSTLLEGTTLGLYPMLLGSGNLSKQAPYLCTVAFDGTDVIRIKKNLITGIWSSGSIGTLTAAGNGIPVSELYHNNSIYFITDQSDKVGIVNFDHDSVVELSWPEQVRHPMDLNVFRGGVHCLNKTVSDSGVAIFNVDPVLGLSKAIQLGTNLGPDMTSNNFHGRNMIFTCTVPGPPQGDKPHMMAFQYVTNASVSGSGGFSGMQVWAVAETGNGNLGIFLDVSQTSLITDEWAAGSNGLIFRPSDSSQQVRKSEELLWRPWVNDLSNAPGGTEEIRVIFRENSEDGSAWRQYTYRNDPNDDTMDINGVAIQQGAGVSHGSYCTARFGGGHYDGSWGNIDVTVSGIEDLPSGKTRVWYIVDGDYLHLNNHAIKTTLLYGGQDKKLSTPHKNIATVDGAISGIIAGNQLYNGLSSGIPQYVDWNTRSDGLTHRGRINFVVLVETTGTVPSPGGLQKKMSQVVFANINAEPFSFPTGPVIAGRFDNIANETFTTGPRARSILTNIRDFNFSTGPAVPISSGLWSLQIVPNTGILSDEVIWWGFRTSNSRISGFGRAQGI